jgi:hypothetical protein
MGSRPDEMILSIYLIISAALGPEVYSASKRNDYQKQKVMSLKSKAAADA